VQGFILRLFFAALPESEVRHRLASAAQAPSMTADARRVREENYHLTLAFAGEVSNSQAATLRAVGAAILSRACEVCFDVFEYWRKSEVLVIAASEQPRGLQDLHHELTAGLRRLGLVEDPVPFRAHVTLARKVSQAPVLPAMSQLCWNVQAFHLVRSARSAVGSVYTVVDTWPLLDEEPRAE
jgi:2'-5' RNA ligase